MDILKMLDEQGSLERYGLLAERRADGTVRANVPHVVCHSPTGFEIGYGGSGPADLALSVMHALLPPKLSAAEQAAAMGDDERPPREDLDELLEDDQAWSDPVGPGGVHVSRLAYRLHQKFKRDFLATEADSIYIEIGKIREWIEEHRSEMQRE